MPVAERMRPLLGTFITIQAEGPAGMSSSDVALIIDSAFQAITQVDRLMSVYHNRSDIGRLNRARPGSTIHVHELTYRVLSEALQLWHWSEGAFDCNIGRPLIRAGLLPKTRSSKLHHDPFGEAIGLRSNRSVKVNVRLSLDLGGIAKGFAVDQAIAVLRAQGMVKGVVNAGGDLRIFGKKPLSIEVRCPNNPSQTRTIGMLSNGAIATTASYFINTNRSTQQPASAIVDTRVNKIIATNKSVSVIARNCLLADGLTKVAILKGRLPTRLVRYAQANMVTI